MPSPSGRGDIAPRPRPRSRRSIAHMPTGATFGDADKENATTDLGSIKNTKNAQHAAKALRKSRSKSIGPGGLDALTDDDIKLAESNVSYPKSILKPTIPLSPLRQIPSRTPTYPALDDDGNIIMRSQHPLLNGKSSLFDIPKPSSNSMNPGVDEGKPKGEEHTAAQREREEKEERERQRREIQERRDARRKSLANRRVSFAPEATLHTWDVIEYAHDSTTSSASSNSTRRASSASSTFDQLTSTSMNATPDSPSTPPKRTRSSARMQSPRQRQSPQKKRRRRSSTIPPMNFNNPDEFDDISSSPSSGGSEVNEELPANTSQTHSPVSEHSVSEEGSDDDQGTASMVLDTVYLSGGPHNPSQKPETGYMTQDADDGEVDDDGEVTMEIVGDEITSAFQPWMHKPSEHVLDKGSFDGKDLLYPELKQSTPPDENEGEDLELGSEGDADMTMDLTRGVGRIVPPVSPEEKHDYQGDQQKSDMAMSHSNSAWESLDRGSSPEEMAMELTMPLGKINGPANQVNSILDDEEGDENEEMTMEFTSAIGGLLGASSRKEGTPEPTTPQQKIVTPLSFSNEKVIEESAQAAEATVEEQSGSNEMEVDMEMDMTQAMGGILPKPTESAKPAQPSKKLTKEPSPAKFMENQMDEPAKDFVAQKEAQKEPTLNIREMIQSLTPKRKIRGRKSLHTGGAKGLLGKRPLELDEESDDGSPSKLREKRNGLYIPSGLAKSPSVGGETPKRNDLSVPVLPPKSPSALRETPKKSLTSKTQEAAPNEVEKENVSFSPVREPSPIKPKVATPRKAGPRTRSTHASRSEPLKSPAKPTGRIRRKDNIQLQEFLNLTSIRFMELTTTKRRDTTFARNITTGKNNGSSANGPASQSFDDHVAAGTCTVPMLQVYQKSCNELKNKLSDGRNTIQYIEARSSEDNPPLFEEYTSAPPDIKSIMDNQLKNMKTYARLQSKRTWYEWRMNLLKPAKSDLESTLEGLATDEKAIASQEKLLQPVLPTLFEKRTALEKTEQELRTRAEELAKCDLQELRNVRDRLVDAQSDLEEQTRLLEELQSQMREVEDTQADLLDRKAKVLEDTAQAEKTREECRGYESSEIISLEAEVQALEQQHGWSIKSASATDLVIAYTNGLNLTLSSPNNSKIGLDLSKASMGFSYSADALEPILQSAQSQATLNFFLRAAKSQFAHALTSPEGERNGSSTINLAKLLSDLRQFWDTACDVTRRIHSLALSFVTDVQLLSSSSSHSSSSSNNSSNSTPDVLEVRSMVLLPALRSKVLVRFVIAVSGIKVSVDPSASIIYGNGVKPHPDRLTAYLNRKIGGIVGDWKEKNAGKKSLGGVSASASTFLQRKDKDLWRRTVQEFQSLLIMGKAIA
ncbi:Spc7-domain-containing protein [Xylona heveae TC161]|uniref:Spc7-domain-containing protein n=1 Tax=Xylona heveae (strain CBS 132557 / TC161) TaxID=1328760 RepID=A0A165I081_XYLHT|nr:Spc7-domain-containing protein [Xylona heveae TC161]KZF24172.1 Spc7-domain-containing protein [Xylona heveae TC161]